MVATGTETLFVNWTSAARREARRVTIDGNDRVVTLVAFAVAIQPFAHARIIIKSTGVLMVRRTAAFRTPMTPWCLLAQWSEIVQRTSPFSESDLPRWCRKCMLCDAIAKRAPTILDGHTVHDRCVIVCRQCLSPWHISCATSWFSDRAAHIQPESPFECGLCT